MWLSQSAARRNPVPSASASGARHLSLGALVVPRVGLVTVPAAGQCACLSVCMSLRVPRAICLTSGRMALPCPSAFADSDTEL